MGIANPVLGKNKCLQCGGETAVMQTKRKGAHLYERCGECGICQQNGKAVQNRLWHTSVWLPESELPEGVRPVKPSNVDDEWQPNQPKEPTEKATELTDFDPESVTEPETEKATENKPKGSLLAVGGVLVAGALGYVFWSM